MAEKKVAVQAEKKVEAAESKKTAAQTEKQAAPKRKTATKKEIKMQMIIEHQGKQVEDKAIISAVKKAWTKTGKKVGEIKAMELYIKPEEESVYYVINGQDTGKVDF